MTSVTEVPEPRAIRSRRDPLMILGSVRSFVSHRVDDGVDAVELPLVDVHVLHAFELPGTGHHGQHAADPAHLLDLRELGLEVGERELRLAQALLHLLGILGLRGLLGLLDQRDHIAHAEDALGHAIGMERLERVELLPHAGEHDRLAGDALDRERRTAACVAVELGEHHAVEVHALARRPPRR